VHDVVVFTGYLWSTGAVYTSSPGVLDLRSGFIKVS
jgi:peptide methionine sulfoxide reductase MsrA